MATILFTAAGRRVQLIRHFKDNNVRVIGTDINPEMSAACHFCDARYHVPSYHSEEYIDRLVELCRSEAVTHLIPLYEPELIKLAASKSKFEEIDVKLILSSYECLSQTLDKYELYNWFNQINIQTPITFLPHQINRIEEGTWVVKPRRGMGSRDVHIINHMDIDSTVNKMSDPIIQRYIDGMEYTVDAYVDDKGTVRSIVPRMRLEVKAGEVSKSITCFDEGIIVECMKILKRNSFNGPITIQGIKEKTTGAFYFTEINPRFGGGVPLSIEAGIPYADFIVNDNRYPNNDTLHPFITDLKMIRYDEALFVK